MATKSEVVRLRCTEDEKVRWMAAAGGERRLSSWLRDLANREVEGGTLISEPVIAATQEALGPPPMPTLLSHHPEGFPSRPLETIGVECPRERHHRKGRYCASCQRISK